MDSSPPKGGLFGSNLSRIVLGRNGLPVSDLKSLVRSVCGSHSAALQRVVVAVFILVGHVLPVWPQTATQPDRLLSRRYLEGERLQYVMKGQEDGTTYEVRLTATVKKTADGGFVEEYAWSDLIVNGTPRALAPTSQAFRQAITLAGGAPFAPPDLSKTPGLIGPVTDLLTFYADLFLAIHGGVLRQAGDRFYFHNPVTASWADGSVVVIGEDHVDFDITLTDVDARSGVAVLLVKHVPPAEPRIRLAAEWMRSPVADTPNNFVQVRKTTDGYSGSVGKETFDVELRIAVADGKILSATMDNPVTKVTRECADATLAQCGEARPTPTFRHVEMSLVRE